MNEKTRMLLGIIVICILGISAYMYMQPTVNIDNVKIVQKEENNILDTEIINTGSLVNNIANNYDDVISEEEIPTEISIDSIENEFSTGSMNINQTTQLNNKTDIEYSEETHEKIFKNSMVKYPEILEYPEILDAYVGFNGDTQEIRYNYIDMKKYESLWIDLYENDLFEHIDTQTFGYAKWNTFALYKLGGLDKNTKYSSDNCADFDSMLSGCMIIISSFDTLKFIYNIKGEIKEFKNGGNVYVFNTSSGGDGCGAYNNYSLYSINGKLINNVLNGHSGCESTIESYKKGDLEISFIYYRDKYKGDFQELTIEYKNKLVVNKIYKAEDFSFTIDDNLLNGDNLEIKIGKSVVIFQQKDYINKSELKSHYGMYGSLEETGKGYKFIGKLGDSFEYNSIANKISILNCKDNDSDILDELYRLNKYIPGEIEYFYNISKEYGNYCVNGIYTVKIEVENKKTGKTEEWIEDYTLNLK